jgi:hypothetical protein
MILQRSQELSKVTGHRGKDAVRAFFRTVSEGKVRADNCSFLRETQANPVAGAIVVDNPPEANW